MDSLCRVKARYLPLVFVTFAVLMNSVIALEQLAPAVHPPGGLTVAQSPQFVLLGFDDNPDVEPMTWIVDHTRALRSADGTPVRAIFFSNGKYWNDPALVAIHRRALVEGHEIANHTQNHPGGAAFTATEWSAEIVLCADTFAAGGIPRTEIIGFRAPFLAYNDATFSALTAGYAYDSSIEEGMQPGQDGTNFLWPYTLDAGSPGNAHAFADAPKRVGSHPRLWEIPIHVFLVPADAECARFGVTPGLQARVGANLRKAYGRGSGEPAEKISGLDWNVLEAAKCDGPEFLAILKYTLDLRLAGNRAPMMVGAHTALYPATDPGRRQAMEEFIAYALTKPAVRFVTGGQLLEWMRKPQALR